MHADRSRAFLSNLHATAETQRNQQVAANMIFGAAATWGNLLLFLVLGGLVSFAPLLADDAATGRPLLAQYALVLIYLISPLQVLLDSLNPFGQANVALSKVEELGLALPRAGHGEILGEAGGEVRRPLGDAVAPGDLGELGLVAPDEHRLEQHPRPVRELDAALLADREDGADEVLAVAHASRDAIHDDSDFMRGHGGREIRCAILRRYASAATLGTRFRSRA